MNESTPLAGQVALVTGAGRGIGRAIAIAYAHAGAHVVVAARTATELDALVAEIEAAGGAATAVPTDVTSTDAVDHLFARIDELGGLDLVMLNAGGLPGRGPVADSDVAVWNETIALNLTAAYLCARAAVPRLRGRGGGKIILVGSGIGHRGVPELAAYACAKAGQWMLARVLAQELQADAISVNELIPGPVATDIGTGDFGSAATNTFAGEWSKTADDVVPLALMLATQPNHGPSAQSFSLMRRDNLKAPEANPMILEDKVVVVTGVGPGLGRSMALAAAEEGARVVCMARTESFVAKVVDEITDQGGEALAVPGDITSADDCGRVVSATEQRFGRLDGLVNSAFTAGPIALFEDADLDAWRQVFEVNVFGTLSMIRTALPLMRRDGGGAVVNVNTMSATRPMRMQGAYGGSKAALEFLTRQLAVELGPHGVRCNTVYCGPMLGPNLADAMDTWAERRGESREEVEATVATNMAIGRIPADAESARVMMLLLSDHAGIVTGAALHATGGVWLENRI